MIGVEAHPERTLTERVLERLRDGPATPAILCRGVLGLPNAPAAVCDRVTFALLGADPRVRQLPDGRWSLVAEAQGSPLIEECAFAIVDVETTGTRAGNGDRITEIAIVVMHGGRREVVFESLINPERPIPATITDMTNISDAMVRDAPTFADVADQILAALAGRVFVAHNARFDWSFVAAEMRRARDLALDGPRLCTVRLARRLVRGVQSCGLDNLSRFFGFENPSRHRAAGDALVTAELLARLLSLARDDGARTLQDLSIIEARRKVQPRARRSALPSDPRSNSSPEPNS